MIQTCTPAAATALLQAQAEEDQQQESPLTMTLPPTAAAASSSGPPIPTRLRFEYHTPETLPKAWREPLFQVRCHPP